MKIVPATFDDIPELDNLVQSCYRGDSSRQGWTHEADLLDGTRATPELLREDMSKPGALILKGVDETGKMIACVYTEKQADKMYLGMLCVRPDIQAKGLGKQMMTAAEDLAKRENCCAVKMWVLSCRSELIAWYERRGYRKTGETAPFLTNPDNGIPKVHLDFIVLQKDF